MSQSQIPVLDAAADGVGSKLYELAQLYDFPDFVKQASREQLTASDEAPLHLYADPVRRLFYTGTAPATWLSAAYFLAQKQAYAPDQAALVERRLDEAALFFGVEPQLKRLKEAHARLAPLADGELADEDFALVLNWSDGVKERHYRLTSAAEVTKAASYLQQHRAKFLFDDRQAFAAKVLAKAAALQVDLGEQGDFLRRQAGGGFCSADKVASLLLGRAKALRQKQAAAALQEKLAEVAQEFLARPGLARVPANLYKAASFVDSVDLEFGLKGLPEPESLFDLDTAKVAAVVADNLCLSTGPVYSRAALAGLSLESVRGALGDDLARRVTEGGLFLSLEKLAEAAPHLPAADAHVLAELFEELGAKPVHQFPREKLLSEEGLRELANFGR